MKRPKKQADEIREVGAYEAKTHLSQLLDAVGRGGRFQITRHGVPVAFLVPPRFEERPDAREVIAALRRFRRGITTGGTPLKEMIAAGRR